MRPRWMFGGSFTKPLGSAGDGLAAGFSLRSGQCGEVRFHDGGEARGGFSKLSLVGHAPIVLPGGPFDWRETPLG